MEENEQPATAVMYGKLRDCNGNCPNPDAQFFPRTMAVMMVMTTTTLRRTATVMMIMVMTMVDDDDDDDGGDDDGGHKPHLQLQSTPATTSYTKLLRPFALPKIMSVLTHTNL